MKKLIETWKKRFQPKNKPQKHPDPPFIKAAKKRTALMLIPAALIGCSLFTLGLLAVNGERNLRLLLLLISILCAASCALHGWKQYSGKKKFDAGKRDESIAQQQQNLLSQRENAPRVASEKETLLQHLKRIADKHALSLAALAMASAFFLGGACPLSLLALAALPVLLWDIAVLAVMLSRTRIRLPFGKKKQEENKTEIDRAKFPRIFALVDRAAEAVGYRLKTRVILITGCTASISDCGKEGAVITLGLSMLALLTEEELLAVLLHEFSHLGKRNAEANKLNNRRGWINTQSPIYARFFFGLDDSLYCYEHMLYRYAASLIEEFEADRASLLLTAPEVAASALMKLGCHTYYDWEGGTVDVTENLFESEECPPLIKLDVERFVRAFEKRQTFWCELIGKEIQARSATHPTIASRIEALGAPLPHAPLPAPAPAEFAEECKNAVRFAQDVLYEDMKKSYEEARQNHYLKPLADVTKWEEEGKPLIATEYYVIVSALRTLGRESDAMELCRRACAELSPIAACRASYMLGSYLLHTYDPAGIELIYETIDRNNNYLQEGLDQIGHFCCLTGRHAELNDYRTRALEYAQKQKDIYRKFSILEKGDDISLETLPDQMLQELLDFIRSADQGNLEKVYLLHKTIDAEHSTSVVILRYTADSDEKVNMEVYQRIFRYLDTAHDHQFSIFPYCAAEVIEPDKYPESIIYRND